MALNIKMGVDVSEFNKNIREAREEIKTLDENLKLIDATFKATGDAEAALTQKSEALSKQLELQEGLVEQFKTALTQMTAEGVDPASKQYQQMARNFLKAQTDVQNTKTKLNELSDTTKNAADNAKDLNTNVQDIGKKMSLDQVISGIGKITGALEKGVKQAAKLGKAIMREVLGAADWADDLKTTAQAYGITPDELQRMEKTSEIIDTDVDTILKAKQRLAKDPASVKELFGITSDGRTIDDVFWDTGKAIMAMGDAFKQEEAAQKVFGKSWHELVPLFEAGREEYERINGTWSTVSDEQLESLTKLDDQYKTLKSELETLKLETLSQLAEPMSKVLSSLNDFIKSEEGQKLVGDAMNTIKGALDWMVNNEGAVVGAITAIGGALGLLKVSEGALTFVKLLSGLKDLTGKKEEAKTAASAATISGQDGINALKNGGALGLTGLTMLSPAIIAGMVRNMIPEEYRLDSTARVAAADYTNEDLSRLKEWVQVHNEIKKLEDAYGTDGFDETKYEQAQNAAATLADVLNTDIGKKFWDLLVARDIMPNFDEIPIDLLNELPEVQVQLKVPDDEATELAKDVGVVKIPATLSLIGGVRGFANGLSYVPNNGLYMLHKGERVTPAREVESRNFSSNLYVENMNMNGGLSADALASAIASRNRRMMSGYGS